MNSTKKNVILLVIFALTILSTLFAITTLAVYENGYNDPLPESFFIESDIGMHVQYAYGEHEFSSEQYFTLTDLATYTDLLCSERNNVDGIFDIEDLPGFDGLVEGTKFKPENSTVDGMFPEGTAYDKDTPVGTKYTLTKEEYLEFGDVLYKGKTLAYYKQTGGGACGPKEAYILAELGNYAPQTAMHTELDRDANGNPIKVDPLDGYFSLNNRFVLGEEELFFGVKKYVTASGSGYGLGDGSSADGTYEWVKIKRTYAAHSEDINLITKYGLRYAWSEAIPTDLYDSGVETIPGSGGGSGTFVPGNVVVHVEGDGYYKAHLKTSGSNLQIAWWTTEAGGGGGSAGGNALAEEAEAFEQYILAVSGASSTKDLSRKSVTWIDENGGSHTESTAFDFEYNPSWVTGGEYDQVTVRLEEETNTAVIGPFAIDYFEAHAHVANRSYVQFAGISDMELYTDASDEPLKFGDEGDWQFVWLDGEREKPSDLKYPKPMEKFYIRMKIVENATKITDFKVYFKYMNAAGSYKTYQGTYQIQTWQAKEKRVWAWHSYTEVVDGEETTTEKWEYDHSEYYFELVYKEEDLQAQKLAEGQYGARWYEFCEITRSLNIKSGKLTITKDLVDRDGNVINHLDPNRWFYYSVQVDGAINSGKREWLQVQPGKVVESKVYYWVEGQEAPTFTVYEYKVNEYDLQKLINLNDGTTVTENPISGKLDEKTAIPIKAINYDEKQGYLKIVKEIKDNKEDLLGKDFTFKVTVRGNFIYEDKRYSEESPLVMNVTASSEKPWESTAFAWYGLNNEPRYEVEEVQNVEGAELVEIKNKTGRIIEGKTAEVVAINELIQEKGKLRIIKTLQNAELYDENEIMGKVFSFDITVEGYPKSDAPIELHAKRVAGSYVWEYESQEYVWDYGHNPEYEIVEVNNPKGTYFVKGINSEGIEYTDNSVKGKLSADETIEATVDNQIINKIEIPRYGKLRVSKIIEDTSLKGKSFEFAVTISGTFEYKGVPYKNQTIQIATDGSAVVIENNEYDKDTEVVIKVDENENSWESDTIKWYGNTNPKYTVQEQGQGQDIKVAVNPGSGEIEGAEEEAKINYTEVTAWNRDLARAGKLRIIKKVINSEFLSEEEIKSYKFKFLVKVDRYKDAIITLSNPSLENGEWVWRGETAKYSWNAEQGSPKYSVEEIEAPDGVILDHYENASGTLIENKVDEVEFKVSEASVINKVEAKEGALSVEKRSNDKSLQDKEFKFDVKISGKFLFNGELKTELVLTDRVFTTSKPWHLSDEGKIEWYGNSAPTYSITEQDSDIAELVSIINGSGRLSENKTAAVTIINKEKKTGGYLQIHKYITEGIDLNKEFTFEVRIAKAGEDLASATPKIVKVSVNKPYRSEYIEWAVADEVPRYSVKEIDIPEGVKLVAMTAGNNGSVDLENATATGSLLPNNEIVHVTATNEYKENKGSFKVTKHIEVDSVKNLGDLETSFSMRIEITGTFMMDGELVQDSTRVIEITLNPDLNSKEATWQSPEITWWDNEAPTVTVTETSMPKGWHYEGTSNNGNPIRSEQNEELEIVVSNKFEVIKRIDLTIELGGTVWEDVPQDLEDKNTENSVPNGLINSNEVGLDGVEVYIYDDNGNLATIYSDMNNTPLNQPIITSNGGKWNAPRIKLSTTDPNKMERFNVVFVYDGQTYEHTKFLATSNGDINSYKAASTAGKDKFVNDSMAIDINRQEVNERLAVIEGNSPMDGSGETIGTAISTNGENNSLYYESDNVSVALESSRKASKLKTTNDNGTIYNLFKTEAGTAKAGLTYPFNNMVHLERYDSKITELGLEEYYYYSATYDYCLHINLGLVRRKEADLSTSKDLYSAKVIIDNKVENYKFNTLADIGVDNYSRQLYKDTNEIEYHLGLYTTDYFYRAEIYQTNYQVYDKLEEFYKSIDAIKGTELEVYLTYKITLENDSPTYLVGINGLNDYFDSTFVKPITEPVYKDILDENGNITKQKVADKSYYFDGDRTVEWNVVQRGIKGSDGITYNKMNTTSFDDLKLESGQRIDIFVTFKVEKRDFKGVSNSIALGNKANVAEITSYSTYYSDGSIAGKVDRDSAPDNINITNYNRVDWYEDDTDAAPLLKLTLERDSRGISGKVWEDQDLENNSHKKGLYDADEALIGGLTVELVEKVNVDGTEYDFVWPTYKQLNALGGRTISELTGFDSTIETGKVGAEIGQYSFVGVPLGRYVVRFLYGNNKIDLDDVFGITGDAMALNPDGSRYSSQDGIITANYDGDRVGTTSAIYNGHDYKSAIYQRGFQDLTAEGYLNNKYHDLTNAGLASQIVSDARDSEARRLQVIANSQRIMNTNGEVLATANDKDANHVELYKDYNMFADTAILDLSKVEEKQYAGLERHLETLSTDNRGGVYAEIKLTEFKAGNIDFALVERPETSVVLDKQIKSIKLITNDKKVIFDAEYDISYEVIKGNRIPENRAVISKVKDGYLVAKVELNDSSIGKDVLQGINKVESKLTNEDNGKYTQNFRFINVDDMILQGATISIDYLFTVLNVGETDYTSETLAKIADYEIENYNVAGKAKDPTIKDKIMYLSKLKVDKEYKTDKPDMGIYLGSYYYTGNVPSADNNVKDVVVKTRVRQLVDYIDNDAVFSQEYNLDDEHSWRSTTIAELQGNGFKDRVLVGNDVIPEYSLVDKHGIEFITSTRKNVALSADNVGDYEETQNKVFQRELVPYEVDPENYKSDLTLTVTKVVAAQSDADNLSFDNLAEIVKIENSVGRRDNTSVPGNANPKRGEFETSMEERDASATELVTFTPPTGIEAEVVLTTEILIMVVIALAVIVVGIIIIKKKILK